MDMELGLYTFGDVHPDPVSGATVSPGQRLRDVLERVRLAEEVGLDYVGIGEHHRPDYAISSPSTVIAAALAQTSRITVGSAVTVLSTEDPVRVFQQFATMDLLSEGRVELLAGRGSFIESYPLFGASLDDYDALYDEKIQLLLRLDADERDHLVRPVPSRPRRRPGPPPPVRPPRPRAAPADRRRDRRQPAVVGARRACSGCPSATRSSAGSRPSSRRWSTSTGARTRESGHDAADRFVSVAGMGFVADDGKGARDYFYPYWLDSMRRIASERGFPMPNRISYESQAARGGAYFVGEPEQIAERIVALHEVLHHDRQSFQMDLSGVPQKESLRSIELLGTQVAPLVREALA